MEKNGVAQWDYIPVRDVMNEAPVTVSPKMKLNHAASLMQEKDVASLVVTRKDEPIGCITEKDILRRVVAKNLKPSMVTVKEVMSRPIETVIPSDELAAVARTMSRKKIRLVAVVENRKLLGIITQRDLSNLSPTLLELSREHARINNNGHQDRGVRPGYCEVCRNYAEVLQEKNGLILCKDCIE